MPLARITATLCSGPLLLAALPGCEAQDRVLQFAQPWVLFDAGHDAGSLEGRGEQDGDAAEADGLPIVIDGGSTDREDGGDAAVALGPMDEDCDFSGVWAARQVTLSWALGAPQYASTWYYLEFVQSGEQVVVSEHFDCGIEVKGTVSVKLAPATVRAMIANNLQHGRKGTLKKEGNTCAFSMERFWSVRGADRDAYLPVGADASLEIAAVAANNPLPTRDSPAGAEDWENDGQLGAAWHITGIVSGTRNTVQRDWTEWFSDDSHSIAPSLDWRDDLVVRVRFGNEENVLHASSPTVSAAGTSDATAQHTLTLKFLGRSTADARAQALLKASEFETCLAIQAALPVAATL